MNTWKIKVEMDKRYSLLFVPGDTIGTEFCSDILLNAGANRSGEYLLEASTRFKYGLPVIVNIIPESGGFPEIEIIHAGDYRNFSAATEKEMAFYSKLKAMGPNLKVRLKPARQKLGSGKAVA